MAARTHDTNDDGATAYSVHASNSSDHDDGPLLLCDDALDRGVSAAEGSSSAVRQMRHVQHGRIRRLVRELRTARWLAAVGSTPQTRTSELGFSTGDLGSVGVAQQVAEHLDSTLSHAAHAPSGAAHFAPVQPANEACNSQSSADVIPERDLDEDKSIDEYLSRLLTRVCGEEAAQNYARNRDESGAVTSVGSFESLPKVPERNEPEKPAPMPLGLRPTASGLWSTASNSGETESVRPQNSFEAATTGRRSRPEVQESPAASNGGESTAVTRAEAVPQVDLTQLRALANASTRTAIAAHVNRLRLQSARSKLFSLVLFAIAATIGLYVADGNQIWSLVGVLGAYLLSAAWLIRAIRLAQSTPPVSELEALEGLASPRGAH